MEWRAEAAAVRAVGAVVAGVWLGSDEVVAVVAVVFECEVEVEAARALCWRMKAGDDDRDDDLEETEAERLRFSVSFCSSSWDIVKPIFSATMRDRIKKVRSLSGRVRMLISIAIMVSRPIRVGGRESFVSIWIRSMYKAG